MPALPRSKGTHVQIYPDLRIFPSPSLQWSSDRCLRGLRPRDHSMGGEPAWSSKGPEGEVLRPTSLAAVNRVPTADQGIPHALKAHPERLLGGRLHRGRRSSVRAARRSTHRCRFRGPFWEAYDFVGENTSGQVIPQNGGGAGMCAGCRVPMVQPNQLFTYEH